MSISPEEQKIQKLNMSGDKSNLNSLIFGAFTLLD